MVKAFKEQRQNRISKIQQERIHTATSNYQRSLEKIEKKGDKKEREIAKLERVEAELLERIRNT
jgi:hypothetical protein